MAAQKVLVSFSIFVAWLAMFGVSSEGQPNVPGKKYKRMVPALIHRGGLMDQRGSNEWAEREEGSGLPSPSSWQSKTKAMKELLDVLGLQIPENLAEYAIREKAKKPPKYMVDLYNAIADVNGITRTPGLLDADTVRSIPNIAPVGTTFCKFDLSAVTDDEIIIDAELHLFQSIRNFRNLKDNLALHPTQRQFGNPSSYLIKIFQLYSESNSTYPMKKLISARRVHSHHSGWHIFSILPTVVSWITLKAPNYGLSTEIHSPNGEIIKNVLDRESLQPILVVFTNNTNIVPNDTNSEADAPPAGLASVEVHPRKEAIPEITRNVNTRNQAATRNKRSTHPRDEMDKRNRNNQKKSKRGRNRNREGSQLHQSSDATNQNNESEDFQYGQRTMNREWPQEYVYSDTGFGLESEDFSDYFSDGSDNSRTHDSPTKSNPMEQPLSQNERRRFTTFTSAENPGKIMRNCRRFPLYVNFEEMGWSGWIIHPQGYNAYHCKGVCSFPLGHQLRPTNHATVQSIMHTLGLGNQPVEMPCCAPDKLYDINLLYFDQNDYVVLRRYKDMVAASCACR